MNRKRVRLVAINGRYTHSCLALFYLRQALSEHCPQLEVELCQLTINDSYFESLLRCTEKEPDFIFFSAAIWNSEIIGRLVEDILPALTKIQLVVGGPQSGVLAKKLDGNRLSFVMGDLEAVADAFFKDLNHNQLQRSYQGSILALENPGFAYPYLDSDFTGELQNRHVYYETSKGCPFSCSYCLSAAERGVYHKDLDRVFAELDHLLGFRPKIVRFIDRTFNDLPKRALAIWQYLVEKGKGTLFHFEIAPDRFTSEMFSFLEGLPAGIFQFEIGIQSYTGQTLDAVNRKIDREAADTNLARLVALDTIHLHVDLILGLPHEGGKDFLRGLARLFRIGPHYMQLGLLKLLPDTPIAAASEQFSYLATRKPPYAVQQNQWLSHGELAELYWLCNMVEKFYNNRYFRTFWGYLRQLDEDIEAFWLGLFAVCKDRDFFSYAATQEFMCQLLLTTLARRKDYQLILDILRFDWLRCNNRFLPDCLATEHERQAAAKLRSDLYQLLPQELAKLFGKKERNQFFRKTYFLKVSPCALKFLLGEKADGIVCLAFTAKKQEGIFSYHRMVPIYAP